MKKIFDIGKYVQTIITSFCVTFCQDGSVCCAIVRATTSPTARTARASASALTMPPAIRKMVRCGPRNGNFSLSLVKISQTIERTKFLEERLYIEIHINSLVTIVQ